MLHAVVQRFLHDAIDAGLVVFGKLFGHLFGIHIHPDAAAFGNLARLPLQRRHQAEIVQHGGAQQQRHISHHADGALHLLLDLAGLGVQGGQAVHCVHAFGGADEGGEVGHFHQHAGQGLAHFVVQFARDGAPLIFLGRHQPCRQALQLLAGVRHFGKVPRGFGFQLQDFADTDGGQHQAQPDGQGDGDSQAAVKLRKDGFHPRSALAQLRFVDGADLVGDPQHRHAARKDFIAQKNIAVAPALAGRPFEDRFQHAPVGIQLLRQHLEWTGLLRGQQRPVLLQRGVHILAGFAQAVAMAFGLAALRLQQVVAHVGAGNVHVAADALEQARAQQEVLADIVVGGLDFLQGPDAVKARERHQQKQSAETSHQHVAAGERDGRAAAQRERLGRLRHSPPLS